MTTREEAARLADALLEAVVLDKHMMQAAALLRQWPDAAAQEPVAWHVSFNGGDTWTMYEWDPTGKITNGLGPEPIIRAVYYAAPPAAQPAVEPLTDESAWLIEWQAHGHGPQWWGFNHTPGLFSDWCSDANNAIRFSRKEDAERMRLHVIAVAGFSGRLDYQRQVTVTEHMWPAAHGVTQGEQQ